MILLVASKKDLASLNIKKHILKQYPFKKTSKTFQKNSIYDANLKGKVIMFVTLNQESVNAQNLSECFPNSEIVVFVSRHSSASGKPTLSVHTPGNFTEAGLGGLPKTLSISPAKAMSDALKALLHYKEELNLDYEVTYEATHHGPSLNVPAMFVELGSSEKQWRDSRAAEAVAHSAMHAITNFSRPAGSCSAVLGIGGTHYNQKFTCMALVGEAIFGHMIPKHVVGEIDSEMLLQCRKKTVEKVSLAILDWKGIKGEDKPKLLSTLEDLALPFKKV